MSVTIDSFFGRLAAISTGMTEIVPLSLEVLPLTFFRLLESILLHVRKYGKIMTH